MKNSIFLGLFLCFVLLIPATLADGMPYPIYRPYISEEHQIVLVEVKNDKMITTLDLGVRSKPENVLTLLEEYVYINENNPVWLKTFIVPEKFTPKELCIRSYSFSYYNQKNSPVEVTINKNVVYLYLEPQIMRGYEEPSGYKIKPSGYKIKEPMPPYEGPTYCRFMETENLTDPKFVDVSKFFKPGEYNTVEIRANKHLGFELSGVHLQSNETVNKVKIIIPFKVLPESIEIGGQGIDIWYLESVFGKRKEWYGYYGDRLLTAKEAPELAGRAQTIEERTKSQVSIIRVSSDVSGGFEGKISDIIGENEVSTAGLYRNEYIIVKLTGNSDYETYMDYNAYVIELPISPYEVKRIVIRWVEDIKNKDSFDYYFPLGTGKIWKDNIPYTAVYVKIPEKNVIRLSSIPGSEEATKDNYRFYRWKFVDSKPDMDLYITVEKISKAEEWFHRVEVWIKGHEMAIFMLGGLVILGLIISVRS